MRRRSLFATMAALFAAPKAAPAAPPPDVIIGDAPNGLIQLARVNGFSVAPSCVDHIETMVCGGVARSSGPPGYQSLQGEFSAALQRARACRLAADRAVDAARALLEINARYYPGPGGALSAPPSSRHSASRNSAVSRSGGNASPISRTPTACASASLGAIDASDAISTSNASSRASVPGTGACGISISSSMVGLGNPMVGASGAGPQRPAPGAGMRAPTVHPRLAGAREGGGDGKTPAARPVAVPDCHLRLLFRSGLDTRNNGGSDE